MRAKCGWWTATYVDLLATDLDDVAIDRILKNLLSLGQGHTAGKQLQHVSRLDWNNRDTRISDSELRWDDLSNSGLYFSKTAHM